MPNFGSKNALFEYFLTKNALFGYFRARILKNTIVIFEINTNFVYLQNFTKKQKYLNLGPKMLYLGIFGLECKNVIVITLKFVKIESLTHAVNCGIGSAFSKSPGSTFSDGSRPDPGPLYKVWHSI